MNNGISINSRMSARRRILISIAVIMIFCLIPLAAYATEVFNDNFSSGSNWTITGGTALRKWVISGGVASADMVSTESQLTMTSGVNVSGTVTLKYDRYTTDFYTMMGDYLKVDVYNGSSWVQVDSLTANSAWTTRELDVSAYANSSFKVRFRVDAYGKAYVDNVIILSGAGSPPGAFNLTSPSNGATGQSVTPTLTWGAASGATSYDVYYGTTSPGTLQASDVTGTSYVVPTALSYSTTYYWKIVAKNASGNTTATGAPWSFTTAAQASPPGAFNLTSPSNSATGQSVTPTLTWGAASGATSYDVYYGTTSPGTLQASDVTGTSYVVPTALSYSTTYYWKVVAKNAGGSTTATSAPWSFTTEEQQGGGGTVFSDDFSTASNWTLPGTTYKWNISGGYAYASNCFSEAAMTQTNGVSVSGTVTLKYDRKSSFNQYTGDYLAADVYNGSTWVQVDSLTASQSTWQPREIDVSAHANAGFKVRFRTMNFGTAYVDNVIIEASSGSGSGGEDVTSILYYDAFGRQNKTETTIDGTTYTVQSVLDDLSRTTEMTYPDGSKVYYTYNNNDGSLAKIGSAAGGDQYLKTKTYNQYGQVTAQTMGNNVTINYTYNSNNFLLTNIQAVNGSAQTVQNNSYTYNNTGMITGLVDNKNSYNWTYTYDDLYRLTAARRGTGTTLGGGTQVYNKTYAYNAINNITTFEGRTYSYGDSAHKHAVTNDGTNTYTYDANGNMLSGAGRTLTWNYENKPESITKNGVTTDFVYDGDGSRVKKVSGSDWTIYVNGIYEKDQSGNQVCYISAGGATVKKKSGGTLFFILPDRLGGTSVITNGSGQEVTRQYYEPYGLDDATGSIENESDDHKFTGQIEDPETGLYYYNARYYDPALGRFISADPVNGVNKYAYCGNDPINYSDPTGYLGSGDVYRKGSSYRYSPAEGEKYIECTTVDDMVWMWHLYKRNNGLMSASEYNSMASPYPGGEYAKWQDSLNIQSSFSMSDEVSKAMGVLGGIPGNGLMTGPAGIYANIPKLGRIATYAQKLQEKFKGSTIVKAWLEPSNLFNSLTTGLLTFTTELIDWRDPAQARDAMMKSVLMTHLIGTGQTTASLAGIQRGLWTKGSGLEIILVNGTGTVLRIVRDIQVNRIEWQESAMTQGFNFFVSIGVSKGAAYTGRSVNRASLFTSATWGNFCAGYLYYTDQSLVGDIAEYALGGAAVSDDFLTVTDWGYEYISPAAMERVMDNTAYWLQNMHADVPDSFMTPDPNIWQPVYGII